MNDQEAFSIALEEAKLSYDEGGIPIGAALVSADGKLLGRGRNMRVQKGSPILHVCYVTILTINWKTAGTRCFLEHIMRLVHLRPVDKRCHVVEFPGSVHLFNSVGHHGIVLLADNSSMLQ